MPIANSMSPLYWPQASARVALIEAILPILDGGGNADAITRAAEVLAGIADGLGSGETATRYLEVAGAAKALAHLVRWGTAVRAAEREADRYAIAAKQAARDLQRATDDSIDPALVSVLESIGAITRPDDIQNVARVILGVTMPLADESTASAHVPSDLHTRVEPPRREPLPVAFLEFLYNGTPVDSPWRVQPDVLYDVTAEVKLSRWPGDVSTLTFTPLCVERPDILQAPQLQFNRPSSDGPYTLRQDVRLLVRVAQDYLARPLEIRYTAAANDGESGATLVTVHGRVCLELHSANLRLTPITGFGNVDARINAVRDEARQFGIPDEELGHFLTLVAELGGLAQKALADNVYAEVIAENAFHADIQSRLRSAPRIGPDLEIHPHAGGGVTDLSLHRIRLELKVDAQLPVTVDTAIERWGQQIAQYIVASDRRCGVLAVLDTTPKTAAPGLVDADIALRTIGNREDTKPVLVGTIIIRGNLARPSDHSKRQRPDNG